MVCMSLVVHPSMEYFQLGSHVNEEKSVLPNITSLDMMCYVNKKNSV